MTSRKAVMASEAKQSRRTWGRGGGSGSPRRFAPRDDDSAKAVDEVTTSEHEAGRSRYWAACGFAKVWRSWYLRILPVALRGRLGTISSRPGSL
jgi:hypothetical protein